MKNILNPLHLHMSDLLILRDTSDCPVHSASSLDKAINDIRQALAANTSGENFKTLERYQAHLETEREVLWDEADLFYDTNNMAEFLKVTQNKDFLLMKKREIEELPIQHDDKVMRSAAELIEERLNEDFSD